MGLIMLIAFLVPNIYIIFVLGGSVIGTLVSIVIPVLFYNRAYSDKIKNLQKDKNAEQKRAPNQGPKDIDP